MSVDLLTTYPVNQWIEEASLKPSPKMLFSEFWFEGEVCILFADSNVGKSILAMQIGESISSGKNIDNFQLESYAQKVLLFDFELSDVQVRNRYSSGKDNHVFSANFYRCQLSYDFDDEVDDEMTLIAIEREIVKLDAKTIIIDNLTYLIQDFEKSKYALNLMKELKRLKNKYNLSILVLAHTPKKDFNKPISSNDLQGSKIIFNFCDSSFAIGKSYSNDKFRYLKQIKQRNCEAIYTQNNVCLCEIKKGATNNNLAFHFVEFDNELSHLNNQIDLEYEQSLLETRKLKSEGMTNQQIADILSISESAVRKRLKSK